MCCDISSILHICNFIGCVWVVYCDSRYDETRSRRGSKVKHASQELYSYVHDEVCYKDQISSLSELCWSWRGFLNLINFFMLEVDHKYEKCCSPHARCYASCHWSQGGRACARSSWPDAWPFLLETSSARRWFPSSAARRLQWMTGRTLERIPSVAFDTFLFYVWNKIKLINYLLSRNG